jgi:hypothetical protein
MNEPEMKHAVGVPIDAVASAAFEAGADCHRLLAKALQE